MVFYLVYDCIVHFQFVGWVFIKNMLSLFSILPDD